LTCSADDVPCTLESLLDRGDTFILVQECLASAEGSISPCPHKSSGKGLKALFPGDGSSGAALWPEGKIESSRRESVSAAAIFPLRSSVSNPRSSRDFSIAARLLSSS